MIAFIITMSDVDWKTKRVLDTKFTVTILKRRIDRKDYIGQTFTYNRKDGYTISVLVKTLSDKEADNVKNIYATSQYNWIVDSILEHGKIITPKEFAIELGTDQQKKVLKICEIASSTKPNNRYTELEDFGLRYHDLQRLIDEGLLNENDEVYNNGPTIGKLILVMKEVHAWDGGPYLHGKYYSDKFFFTHMLGNSMFPETEAKFDTLFKGCYKDKYREDGGTWYFN